MLMIAHIAVIPVVACPWKAHLFTEVFSALSKAIGDQQRVHLLPQRGPLGSRALTSLLPLQRGQEQCAVSTGLCSALANSYLPSASHFKVIYCH